MTVPLVEVPNTLYKQCNAPGKVDMIIITDAQCRVGHHHAVYFNNWKKEKDVSLTTIGIGFDPVSMESVSDEQYHVSGISVESEAIQKCMSI